MDIVKELPILVRAEEVRAILEGRKTQERRVLKKAFIETVQEWAGKVYPAKISGWIAWFPGDSHITESLTKMHYQYGFKCPYGQVGDILWVKEAWAVQHKFDAFPPSLIPKDEAHLYYHATEIENIGGLIKRRAMFMPRKFSRIDLLIKNVRVERLQEISFADCRAEGMSEEYEEYIACCEDPTCNGTHYGEKYHLKHVWNEINGKKYPWNSNPWVWVIEFEVVK